MALTSNTPPSPLLPKPTPGTPCAPRAPRTPQRGARGARGTHGCRCLLHPCESNVVRLLGQALVQVVSCIAASVLFGPGGCVGLPEVRRNKRGGARCGSARQAQVLGFPSVGSTRRVSH
eukprot:gene17098-biopygen10213